MRGSIPTALLWFARCSCDDRFGVREQQLAPSFVAPGSLHLGVFMKVNSERESLRN
jgi:hypothetical protein